MTDERSDHERLARLFEEAASLDLGARDRFLDERCAGDAGLRARLAALLDADGAAHAPLRVEIPAELGATPERIGRYRVVRVLGEGGFGIVYLAEQTEPIRRRVAIKVIKPGMDSMAVIARFEAERQALALMDHPNVARVFDAGATERGLPYFVMEVVEGVPITDYCDRERLGIEERLGLFIQVCDAVQHAHTKGIIHRDIKPSNVLVEAGPRAAPKVIDFGIAKALDRDAGDATLLTQPGQIIGTPQYMSPEQVGQDGTSIDTRTDVHALGALLYELLAGVAPFELRSSSIAEIQRVIREIDPARPSSRIGRLDDGAKDAASNRRATPGALAGRLRRELEWIPLKAMRKEPALRYQTAAELGEDVRAYLTGRPLRAGPPGTLYRLRKFVQRNRLLVGAGALVAAALVAATIISVNFGLSEARQRREATLARDDLALVVAFQSEMLRDVEPSTMAVQLLETLRAHVASREAEGAEGVSTAALDSQLAGLNWTDLALELLDRNVLANAALAAETGFTEQPRIRAQLQVTLGTIYIELGSGVKAEPLLREALAVQQRDPGADHPLTLETRHQLAVSLQTQGDFDGAAALLAPVVELRSAILGPDAVPTLSSMARLAEIRERQGRVGEALPLAEEVVARNRAARGDGDPATLAAETVLARMLYSLGRNDEALALSENSLATSMRVLGPDHVRTNRLLYDVGLAHLELRNFDQAHDCLTRSHDWFAARFGDLHPDTRASSHALGTLLLRQGRTDAALPLLRSAFEADVRLDGGAHTDTLMTLNELIVACISSGKLDEADRLYLDFADAGIAGLPPGHPTALSLLNQKAALRYRQGRPDEFIKISEQVLEGRRSTLGPGHPDTLATMSNIGFVRLKQGDAAGAREILGEAVTLARANLPERHLRLGGLLKHYGDALLRLDQHADAESALTEAYSILMDVHGASSTEARQTAGLLASLYEAIDRGEDADRWRILAEPAHAPDN